MTAVWSAVIVVAVLVVLTSALGGRADKQKAVEEREGRYAEEILKAIYVVEFEGHSYLVFKDIHRGGLVHSESCSCKD